MKVFTSSNYKALLYQQKCILVNLKTETIEYTVECESEILNGIFSQNGDYLILTTKGKLVEVYDVVSKTKKASITVEKRLSAIISRFDKGTEYLIAGDKIGEIHAFDLPELKKKTFLLGHCATVITDLASIGDYIASSDRDEKVFICHFPRVYDIQTICVGHKQFINCITTVGDVLFSGSADGSVCCWNPDSSICLHQLFMDEVLELENEEETVLIPQQLFAYDTSCCLAVIDECKQMVIMNAKSPYISSSIAFDEVPVSISRENGDVVVMTKDLRFFVIYEENGMLVKQEKKTNLTAALTDIKYVFEKTTEEEESGELFKRTVKNRITSSMGLEKQFEHNKKQMKTE